VASILAYDFANEVTVALGKLATIFYGRTATGNYKGNILAITGKNNTIVCNSLPVPDYGEGVKLAFRLRLEPSSRMRRIILFTWLLRLGTVPTCMLRIHLRWHMIILRRRVSKLMPCSGEVAMYRIFRKMHQPITSLMIYSLNHYGERSSHLAERIIPRAVRSCALLHLSRIFQFEHQTPKLF